MAKGWRYGRLEPIEDARVPQLVRDPKRIDKVLADVRLIWEHYPDWRLGQLISNALPAIRTYPDGAPPRDLFYVEDDELAAGLDGLIDRLGQ
jgi:hypothetical protein